MSDAGTVTHPSKGLKVSIRSEISGVNEAPLHIRHVSPYRNGPGSIPAGQVSDKSVSEKRKADQVRGIKELLCHSGTHSCD